MPDRAAADRLESAWSDVDETERPERFVEGLDRLRADPFFAAAKHWLVAALELQGSERVVDVGCGTGDDIAALASIAGATVGIDRSTRLLIEARSRHPAATFVVGDARRLPFAAAMFDRLRVDRLVQHLARADDALREFRRVLRQGGVLALHEPDVTSARIDGLDPHVAEPVLAWRAGTRAGAAVVREMPERMARAGFRDIFMEPAVLELDDLGRADAMLGLPDWGALAGAAGALDPAEAARWHAAAVAAAERGRLRLTTTYLRLSARAG